MYADYRAAAPVRWMTAALAAGALALAPAIQAADDHAHHQAGAAAHSGHEGHQMNTERDAEGRRLWGQTHTMTPEMYDELRAKVPSYRDAPKSVIDMSMVAMGPEYQWYISPDTLRSDAGVLIMTHGFREQGDRMFRNQLTTMASVLPTSLSLGMAMMMSDHVQLSINDLEAAGAKKIVVVPILSTRYNELMRQWEYIFGRRKEAEFVTVGQVTSKAEIVMATPPEDHPLVGEIIVDHALEISENPAREFVIIVAHGASGRERDLDNPKELEILKTLARYVKEDGGFADVGYVTLQDDAPPEIRDANVARLRGMAEGAIRKGQTVLVVTNLIGTRTIQPKIREDLKGIDYKFNAKGIAQHANFLKWIEETVEKTLTTKGEPAKAAAR
jgi:sirohydrochlorin cobaltochelatase